ncbi:hypothetical protein GGR56DRAFT_447051 [Xylariaceae sp. FL0804]|nr:hypothetical protein GGR56DRAFT_447051 [Xylariaceae sp. FL0804]
MNCAVLVRGFPAEVDIFNILGSLHGFGQINFAYVKENTAPHRRSANTARIVFMRPEDAAGVVELEKIHLIYRAKGQTNTADCLVMYDEETEKQRSRTHQSRVVELRGDVAAETVVPILEANIDPDVWMEPQVVTMTDGNGERYCVYEFTGLDLGVMAFDVLYDLRKDYGWEVLYGKDPCQG